MDFDRDHLTLTVDGGIGADDEDQAELLRSLRRQLLDSEVALVDSLQAGFSPVGTKGGLGPLGGLAVSVAPGSTVTPVIGMLDGWLARHEGISITLESGGEKVTLTGALSNQQKQTVETLFNRSEARGGANG